MSSLKAFRLNLLYQRKTSMLKPLDLHVLLTVFNFLIMISTHFEVQFSAVRKVILD